MYTKQNTKQNNICSHVMEILGEHSQGSKCSEFLVSDYVVEYSRGSIILKVLIEHWGFNVQDI